MVLKKVGLTGSTGMLGRHLRKLFEENNIEVICTSTRDDAAKGIHGWNLSNWLRNEELSSIFRDVDAVIHVGAMVPTHQTAGVEPEMFDVNVRSCLNLGLWAIEQNIPLLYVSGAIVYRDQEAIFQNECSELGWNDLGNEYGFSKLLGETTLEALSSKGLKLSVVRPSSIYGFGLPNTKMLNSFLQSALRGGTINLYPPVNYMIDFIHARDVATAIFKILKAEVLGIFNVSSGTPLSVESLAMSCVKVAGRGTVLIRDNETKIACQDEISRFSLDSSKINGSVGWTPTLDIEEGLKMMVHGQISTIY